MSDISLLRRHIVHDTISFARAIETVLRWRKRVRDRAQLQELDDRTLADIGLTRQQVNFEVTKPFWRM
ncbi:MAG TPA: DUF1127 domain-containing protein [Candidatus Sulfotelmatobacter sp.]|nr:DUF1127 domain-containing protein [Candidatus Sulfotelmatobacter sp.]